MRNKPRAASAAHNLRDIEAVGNTAMLGVRTDLTFLKRRQFNRNRRSDRR